MKRIKQQLQVVGEKLTNLDVKTKRLLISGVVLAVLLPITIVAALAKGETGNSNKIVRACNKTTGNVINVTQAVFNSNKHLINPDADECSFERVLACNKESGRINTVSKRTLALKKHKYTKDLNLCNSGGGRVLMCNKTTHTMEWVNLEELSDEAKKNYLGTNKVCETGNAQDIENTDIAVQIQSSKNVNLFFISPDGKPTQNQTIKAGGLEWANTVLTFVQGNEGANQPVQVAFNLPQGLSLIAGNSVIYATNNGEWKELPNGANIATTWIAAPVGVGKDEYIHFNIRVQGTAGCGKSQTYPINAKIKLANGTELTTRPINLTINGATCEAPTRPNTPNLSHGIKSQVGLYFVSSANKIEETQVINADGEVANTVLSFFQGEKLAGQPVTASFSLPQGVSLGAGHGIIYNLNGSSWQELPNGANIVTTGVVSPSGVSNGQYIHFNIQLQGTADCDKATTVPINAKIKLADGTELAAQPINLTIKGKPCGQPATPQQPQQPQQPATPDQANYIKVCDQNTNRVITIKESEFDPKTQTKDLSKCPTTPSNLPQTGPADTLIVLLALTALTAGTGYYISTSKAKAKTPKA